ncbi:MAG: orc1/cdc6 family replication initiation protein [Chloroflexi bacterium]|nr:orc1/cdc6 family replication initiation protein [Chloroflexota bacterium]
MKLVHAFSPANPISKKALFTGRDALIRRVIDAINQTGLHVTIYGERGVGKTSLANVLADFLRPFTSEIIVSEKVNCFRDSTFGSIWSRILQQLNLPKPEYEDDFTPQDVLSALPARRKTILIIDEFDRVEDPNVDAAFADTIKTLSDFEIDTTIIIVGVADDVDDLIAEHESINRNLKEVHVPRMLTDELRKVVEGGIAAVEMSIEPDAATQIATLSLGLPHYAHALGQAAGRAAIDAKRINVEPQDVRQGSAMLLRDSQQTILKQFDAATASPRKENYYFQVLLACALAPTDHLGRFRAKDVREPYGVIMKRSVEIPAFSRHLHDLCTPGRGAVLQKFGEAHNFRYRFANPLLEPFVLMKGLERRLVGLESVRPRNV